MYFIYKITNQINQKSYIGSSSESRGFDTRKEEHIKAAYQKSNLSYNYPLQAAIRKYGADNFTYEILESDISTLEERAAQEKYYIEKYNTLTKNGQGYNQTIYTYCALADPEIKLQMIEKTAKKVALVDNHENILCIFNSLHEAARFVNKANTVNNVSQITKICNGEIRSIHNHIFRWIDDNNHIIIPEFQTRPRRTPIVAINKYDFKQKLYFDSILEASKLLNLNRCSIQKCLKGEIRYTTVGDYIFREIDNDKNIIENDIKLSQLQDKYITLSNGETHPLFEWCEILHVSRQSIYYHMKKHNMTKQEVLNYYLEKRR